MFPKVIFLLKCNWIFGRPQTIIKRLNFFCIVHYLMNLVQSQNGRREVVELGQIYNMDANLSLHHLLISLKNYHYT